jgi:hypothetical protein
MDPKIQAQYQAVTEELKESSLAPEHQELLSLRLQDAIACANGSPDKVPLIAAVVALGAIGSARNEIRMDGRITAAVSKGLGGLVEDIRGIITKALDDHIEKCPMRGMDVQELNRRLTTAESRAVAADKVEASEEGGDVLGLKGKAVAYWGKILSQSPQLTGIAILFLVYKILALVLEAVGGEGVKNLVAKIL